MRPPEMSYSPAYHKAQAQVPISTERPLIVPRTRRSPDLPNSSHSGLPRPSNDWGHSVRPHTSPSLQGSHAYSLEASRRQSRVEDDIPVTRIVVSGAGLSHQEKPSRSSWADQPSLMSASNSGTPRTHNRGVPDAASRDKGQDALLMLFRLSIPVPVYAFVACLYTFGALIFAILSTPLRLCSISPYLRNTSFKSQICDLLSPALHTHERLVCMRKSKIDRSSSSQWIHSDDAEENAIAPDSSRYYSVGTLIAVLVFSPFFSLALLLFAWTAAFFWVFTKVMGNPDGTERKDDGRAAVLGVCKWWQKWLGKARKL
ncbi:hypothetical protein N7495_000385 [Penicillium taxi]|uniref:uncharacterized protein n=1 Tax=Penicillium taxi TaxID=168475 RepID=UPI0025453A3C|nr:uncharacterized protein N7495_000385 [Penicillium taxi]KAJ5907703.1 hypothetical protein N7495_000385 [Penicillium taxi]